MLIYERCDEKKNKLPTKPSGQVQLYAATPSLHVPPLRQGSDQHSSQLISQLIPV